MENTTYPFRGYYVNSTNNGKALEENMRQKEKVNWSKKLIDWVRSPEGQKEWDEADRESMKTIEQLREDQRIDPDILDLPFMATA